jgi:hypothetical protein
MTTRVTRVKRLPRRMPGFESRGPANLRQPAADTSGDGDGVASKRPAPNNTSAALQKVSLGLCEYALGRSLSKPALSPPDRLPPTRR